MAGVVHGDRAPGFRADAALERRGSEVQRVRIDVGKRNLSAGHACGIGGGEERHRGRKQQIVFSEPDEQGSQELLCVTGILTCLEKSKGRALKCFSRQATSYPSDAFLDGRAAPAPLR